MTTQRARRRLGDIDVTAIGLGAMPLSLAGRPDEAAGIKVVRAFLDGGGDLIDTANVYCIDGRETGHNERLIRKALREAGAGNVTVATKGGLTKEGSGWDPDGRPESLRRSCEQSLADLGVSRIFLYQLHAPDPDVPFADSVGELARLREAGKIAHVGLSNVNVAQIREALSILPVASVQNKCNISCKRAFRDGVVDFCRAHGIAFIPHSPVGGHRAQSRLGRSRVLVDLAREKSVTAAQIALAWLLHKGSHVIPIPGASRVGSIESSLAALDVRLEDGEIAALDALADW
ncbi:MAG TPA: aldo/keto reductase [Gammaproteobacteria bacterium]|jgi:aryl-alcohol dehydrogenase-like predicted oxidoreductase